MNLDTIIELAASQFGLGDKAKAFIATLLARLTDLSKGGIGGIIDLIKKANLGSILTSPDGKLNIDQVRHLFGNELGGFASKLGLSETVTNTAIGSILPLLLKYLAPHGVAPTSVPAEVSTFLKNNPVHFQGNHPSHSTTTQKPVDNGGSDLSWLLYALPLLALALVTLYYSSQNQKDTVVKKDEKPKPVVKDDKKELIKKEEPKPVVKEEMKKGEPKKEEPKPEVKKEEPKKEEPKPEVKKEEPKKEEPKEPAVDAAKVIGDVKGIFGLVGDSLKDVKDAATAEAALPKLTDILPKIDAIKVITTKLPADAKDKLKGLVTEQLAGMKDVFTKVTAIPGIGEKIKAALEKLTTAFSTLYQ